MLWKRQYKRRQSSARNVLKRIERKGKIAGSAEMQARRQSPENKVLQIPPENYFHLCSGSQIKDIQELASVLEGMSEDEFRYHVNQEKNDFSSWIRNVFNMHDLADALHPVDDRQRCREILLRHTV
jgi:hypothetical protein